MGAGHSWKARAKRGTRDCMRRLFAWAWAVAVAPGPCAGCPPLSAAESGARARLGTELATRQNEGHLSLGEAAAIARAVAEHDLRQARGDDAVVRVGEARSCAHE